MSEQSQDMTPEQWDQLFSQIEAMTPGNRYGLLLHMARVVAAHVVGVPSVSKELAGIKRGVMKIAVIADELQNAAEAAFEGE